MADNDSKAPEEALSALELLRAEKLRRSVSDDIPPPTTCKAQNWPPNYEQILSWRAKQLALFQLQPELVAPAKEYYKYNLVDFINHWCSTYDPRLVSKGLSPVIPFILFPKQEEFCDFLMACFKHPADGLTEKARDMGATWLCCAFSVWLWLFYPGSSVGWGSNKEDKVDKKGDPSCIFEKMRMIVQYLPKVFIPTDFKDDWLAFERFVNHENGATIIGEAGDNIGRGGRTTIYFVDEASHLDRPEKVEASLGDTTRCRIDISSVSGPGTVFYRKREAGKEWHKGQEVVRDRTNVFILDWRDHPEKTQEWYNERRKKAQDAGNLHILAQEVDRDYSAALQGAVIPMEWAMAAIGAAEKLGIPIDGNYLAGLDVADGGGDTNGLTLRKGISVIDLQQWGERDTGVTTRNTVTYCSRFTPCELQYDCVGIGAGVKSEANRLKDVNLWPEYLDLIAWNAGSAVLKPHEHIIPDDPQSPTNKQFFANLKAQAWWNARLRFERTFRALNEPDYTYDPEDLISINPNLPLIHTLVKQLAQVRATRNTNLKVLIDKMPEGMRSPNLADSLVMCYFPLPVKVLSYSISAPIVISA